MAISQVSCILRKFPLIPKEKGSVSVKILILDARLIPTICFKCVWLVLKINLAVRLQFFKFSKKFNSYDVCC